MGLSFPPCGSQEKTNIHILIHTMSGLTEAIIIEKGIAAGCGTKAMGDCYLAVWRDEDEIWLF